MADLLQLQRAYGNDAVTRYLTGLAVQRQPAAPTAPPDAPAAPAIEPQHRNEKIATWVGWVDTPVSTMMLLGESDIPRYIDPISAIPASITRAGWTPGHFETEAAALGAIKASGTAGAVFVENGQYVAYHVKGETMLHDFTLDNLRWFADKPWTGLRFDAGAAAIVTMDGATLRSEHFKTKDEAKTAMADQALMPGERDPLSGYQQAFGDVSRPGVLEMVFLPAMKDNALAQLSASRREVERDIERRSSSGLIPPGEIKLMRDTAEYLAGIDEEMDRIPKTLPPDPEAYDRFWALSNRRKVVLARYPMLARVDPRQFVHLPEDQQMALLGTQSLQVREDIDKARNDIIDGTLNLWAIPSVVDSTIAGLGISDPKARKRVHELAEANRTSIADTILTLFSVVFGVAAIVTTGPLGVAVAAGAFGLSVADAIKQTEEIAAEHSAANTALDPTKSLLPPEDARSWGWLVVAWMGVVADGAQVISAIKAVKAAEGAIDAGVKVLAKGDETLAGKLRLAAGAGDVTEVVSEVNKAGLARRIGTNVEIEADLGKEVRVYYKVDSEGRVVVEGIRCGPEAKVGDILAHAPVVRMLQRYDGLLGRLRELIDKLMSLAGYPPAGVNPFPPGSQAFESFLEVTKLPDVIKARRAELAEYLGTESEAVLRREVDFLENELTIHGQVVDQMVTERGVGFIAAAGEDTKKAIAQYHMPDLFHDPLVKDPTKYYYRINPGPPPPYLLTRFANADVPALSIVADGSGGWKIAEGALSRAEQAKTLIGGWPPKVQDAFKALESAFKQGVFRVVPLEGVAATGKKIGQMMDSVQRQRLSEILFRAFKAAKDPDPAAKATQVVEALLDHEMTVVKGTDQLRAYNYRLAFEKAAGAEAAGDLHHAIPLYLGGDNTRLIDMEPGLHDALHDLIDGIHLEPGVSLAPASLRSASSLTFQEGAAILYSDGRVQLASLSGDGTYHLVP